MHDSIWSDMFAFQIPPTEKIARTVLVYAAVALLIRPAHFRLSRRPQPRLWIAAAIWR